MEEIYKDIIGYEGSYQISNLGNVKSLNYRNTGKEGILKPNITKNGYLTISLYKNGIWNKFKIHRLVGLMFIPNPDNKPQINHINGIKTNNRIENLEWNTASENQLHRFKVLLQKSSLMKKIKQYSLNSEYIKTWDCMMDVERELNISNSKISMCCTGKRNKAGGFKWGYV